MPFILKMEKRKELRKTGNLLYQDVDVVPQGGL